MLGAALSLRAAEAVDSVLPSQEALPNHVVSLGFYRQNRVMMGYEQVLRPWLSAFMQVNHLSTDYGPQSNVEGLQLQMRLYPFGGSPTGFFGYGTFSEEWFNGQSDDLPQRRQWYGVGIGYQWILVRHLSLQAAADFNGVMGAWEPEEPDNGAIHTLAALGWTF